LEKESGMLQPSSLKFLKALKKNNNKVWFDAHRPAYESARRDFEQFIQRVIDSHGKKDSSINDLTAKSCLFRINRDVRFSKDKSPYKSNFGASINKGGRKAMNAAGYYFHLEPGHSFLGGGLYVPMPDELKKVRQEIDYNFDAFRKIINARGFKSIYGALDRSESFLLTRVPKGYDPDNAAADYLRLKSFIAMIPVTDAELTSSSLLKKTTRSYEPLQPLIEFINESII
jgi:uncharacterized protein (TIGR02453 family)